MAVNWNKNLKDWMTNSYNPDPNINIQNARTDTEDYTDNAHPVQQPTPQTQPTQPTKTNNIANIFNRFGNGVVGGLFNAESNFLYGLSKLPQARFAAPITNKVKNLVDNTSNDWNNQNDNGSIAYSAGKALPNLAMAFIPGVGLEASALNAAAEGGNQAQAAGKGGMAQLGNALTKGALNYGLMKLPIGSLGGEVGGTLTSKLGSVAKTAALGAGAGGIGSIGNTITDKAFVNSNTQFNGNDILSNTLMGGVLGGGFRGIEALRPNIKLPNNPSNDNIPLPKETPSTSTINPLTKPKYNLLNPDGVLNTKPSYKYNFDANSLNNKTWYHGTGTENLTSDQLTPTKTNIEGLFGQGVYLTDNPKIAEGYANARSKRTRTPNIYQSNININKAVNLEKPMPNDAYDSFKNIAGQLSKNFDAPYILDNMESLKAKNATGDEIYKQFSSDIGNMSADEGLPKSQLYEYFTDLNADLKDKGYDAFTHVGGKRTGNDPHQVAILLDPNGEFGGSKNNVTNFEPYQNNLGKLNGDIKNIFNASNPMGTIKPSIGANDRTQSGQAIVTGKNNVSLKSKLNDFKQQAKINLYDINAPIENISKGTYKLATNSKKAGGTVSHILNNNLVDMQGNTIGEGLQSIAKDIPRNQEKDFFNYVLQKHNIDRARQETTQVPKVDKQGFLVKDKNGNQVYNDVVTKEATPIFTDFTPEQSQKAVNLIEQRHPEYKAIGDRLTGFINNFENEWGNKSGLINNDLWKSIQDTYKNYIPTQRSFTELEKGAQATGGKGFVDQGNTLKRAKGSERDIINPVENIANLVNRTVRTARYNEVGQSLLNAVESNPQSMSKYAELIPPTEKINPNVNNVVSVLRNGEPVNIQINDKNLLESLQGLNKNIDFNAAEKVLGKLNTGFKSLITTKNPVFALRNMARDLPTAYVYGNEHNPLKFGANYLGAMKSLITNDAAAQQYKALGGEAANFFNSDRAYKTANELMNRKLVSDKSTGEITGSKKINPVLKTLKGVNNGVEKFNNIIESAPRLAEFKSTLKKGGNVQDALYNSGEITTNFSRGGKAVKRLDNSVPYLNASMQGLGKFGEQITKKPIQTLAKGIVSTTIPALALQAMNSNNPNYKDLDNRTKDNYFVFPNATGPKDSQGNPETFVKIPKSRELGAIFGALAERTSRQLNGDPQAYKGIGSTIATNISPTNPFNNNIFAPLAINLPTNKDFAGRTIVPMSMQDRTPKYQYDENTSNIAKGIGQLTGLSPKQVDYIVKSYTGVIGQMAENATTPSNYTSKNSGANIFMPVTGQFKSDVLYNNQNLQDFYDNMDKAKTAAADKNFVDNVPSKDITPEETINSGFTRASKAMSELSKAADQATREGDINQARQYRMQMLQIAQDANKGTFPLTATQQKAATKSTTTKTSTKSSSTSSKLKWK